MRNWSNARAREAGGGAEQSPAQLNRARRAGVLLHPTSLPGPAAAGVLGADARRFVDLIADAGFTVWQVLPLGPVDSSRSPYQLKSVHAGNPALIDMDSLRLDGWDLGSQGPVCADDKDAFAQLYRGYRRSAAERLRHEFRNYWQQNRHWLTLYALFESIRREFGQSPWWEWPQGLRDRDSSTMRAAIGQHQRGMREIALAQYLFDRQWSELRHYAARRGISIVGDLPFYVDHDSVEVWWHRQLFDLDPEGAAARVAGVPPDYFNADGQRWGNPTYAWDRHAEQDFRWWMDRFASQAGRFDGLRIDHFRALESFWAIPREAESARDGRWEAAPGDALLTTLRTSLPELSLWAEDLGTINQAVHDLRDRNELPGMLVLQFAFDGSPDNPYLPANHSRRSIVYTGTHDNDTTVGWYRGLDSGTRAYVHRVVGDEPMPDALVRAAHASPAQTAVIPMQDLLGLGSASRMNVPGTIEGNWSWRFNWDQIPRDFVERFRTMAGQYDRLATTASDTRVPSELSA